MLRGREAAGLAALLNLAALRAGGDVPVTARFAADPLWDDGKAEVARYAASRPVYGEERRYEAVLVTVKEDLDARTLVKAEPAGEARALLPVLKLNLIREIPTPNYDYRFLTSVFVERANPARLVRLTSGSQEWCGNTFKSVRARDRSVLYEWSSYFDGEAEGRQQLDLQAGNLLFEDQLPVTLRGLEFRDGLEIAVRLIASFATNRAGPLAPVESRLVVTGPLPLDLPAGRRSAWKVAGEAGDRSTALWFDRSPPHLLLRWETTLGDRLELLSVERRAYWVLRAR